MSSILSAFAARLVACALLLFSLVACDKAPLNNPYPPVDAGLSVLYSAFAERPKHLDPAVAYSSDEYAFIGQIYEPPLQYHYLKRPYQLQPLTATQLPTVRYLDAQKQPLPDDADASAIVFSEYLIKIKPDIHYQPHPAFSRNERGDFLYHALDKATLNDIDTLADLPTQQTRTLRAEDYVYQIKRLAHPKVHSPIAELMAGYIDGFAEFAQQTANVPVKALKDTPMLGAYALDEHRYRILIKGRYPQFLYWLAMPFFAPMPWEADAFYDQPGLKAKNITLDWFPVGTGPYWLEENNPNRRMVLSRNKHYHPDFYPTQGDAGDFEAGLLADAGKRLPFVDRVVYTLEKESIPYWIKFLQGYYDASGITSDSFDQAVTFSTGGDPQLTPLLRDKQIQLQASVSTSIFYLGFNMLDPVVGGDSERARKLRQALSIAVDYEEFISIFANGRGVAAQGVLPPGIFGHQDGEAGLNPVAYDWRDGRAMRKPIADAKRLMTEAGYANGIDPATGRALLLYFDTTAVGTDDRALMNWYRKQFEKLGIELVVRGTDYNRFQEKMRTGAAQIFVWGWNADYPDPENFFFLLYGPNSKVKHGGENAGNYANPEFDRLFEQMRNMDNSPERQHIIDQMQTLLRTDAPWLFGYYPKDFALLHSWYLNMKPARIINNRLKYSRIEDELREQKRRAWNQPIFWPLLLLILAMAAALYPAFKTYKRRQRRLS
ncbi:MAG: ABC transporter substrate-binding protein [Methylomonas sp.]|nr:ABC transporter substrate-binding protein [Methylomonas sp.]PPD20378.1 MAG: peptide ABC transporter substrate-binding protein [Methylomonas sp.]PPD25409.1 MAG: peptide ABC transporter substrate-binding protein [Methylomonas sp.]PPD35966.1 MAG: peptide ABC transporter substrate-binding protein [Methylomonas sp.]PPD37745.1 MAG: peptide ABC transporter substrate-binding protein [Methylomonas sp.]